MTTDYSQVSSYFWQDSSFFGYTEITIATSGLASFLRVDSSGKETKMEFMLIEKELKDLISLFEKEKFFAERHRTSGTPIPDEANITITLKNSSGKVLHSVTQRDTQKTPSFKILNDAFTNDAFTKVVDTHK